MPTSTTGDRVTAVLKVMPALLLACSGQSDGGRARSGSPQSVPSRGTASQVEAVAVLELETSYAEPFGYLSQIRELEDGTVLAADPLSQVVLRIDLARGTADTLGRVGPGPGEYGQPDAVLPLPGDSTLLVDLGKAYLARIDPDGVISGGASMFRPGPYGRMELFHPRFGDGNGGLYTEGARHRLATPSDSAPLLRFALDGTAVDTVASLWVSELEFVRSDRFGLLPPLLQPRDDWAVGADGTVAIVRARDFSIEWLDPEGRSRVGPPHAFVPQPVSRHDKEILLAEFKATAVSSTAVATPSGGTERMSMRRGGGEQDGPQVEDFVWAENLPAFRPERARISGRGEVWVERWLPPDSMPRMEVFDRMGVRLGFVQIPSGRHLIAFGRTRERSAETAYLVRTDEYDLKWLEKYRIERTGTGPATVAMKPSY